MKEHKLQLLVATFLCVAAAALLIAGFCVTPKGEIHNSVLIAFGEVLSFAGAVFGIHYTYSYKNRQSLRE